MQDLGSVFRGLVVAKAPFNCSSGSEDIRTYLPELVQPRSPLELLRGGLTPGGGEGHAHDARGPLGCKPLGSSPLMVQ